MNTLTRDKAEELINNLTDEQIEARWRALFGERVGCPTFQEFVQSTVPFPLDEWQIHLCERLGRLSGQSGQRVAIHAPPQLGKSILVSQRLPAYMIGCDPTHRVKVACYNITKAARHGRVARNLIRSKAFSAAFPGGDKQIPPVSSAEEWSTFGRLALNDGQPSFKALGLQTGFVGEGVDLLVWDDPYASPQDALSEVIRNSTHLFWTDSAKVRVNDDTNVVVMFHRYHEDDSMGRLLAEEGRIEDGGLWEVFRYAAEADGEDDCVPPDREPNTYLSPRYSNAWYEEQKKAGMVWQAQFQGQPTAREGSFFKIGLIEIVDAIPAEAKRCRGWDKAATAGAGDYTAGTKIAAHNGIFYIEDCVRGQWDTAQRDLTIRQTAELDGIECAIWGEQEPSSGGKDAARSFLSILAGFNVQVQPSTTNKQARADAFSAQVNAGNVKMLRNPEWNRIVLEEMRTFPLGKNDDIVDGASGAFNRLAMMNMFDGKVSVG